MPGNSTIGAGPFGEGSLCQQRFQGDGIKLLALFRAEPHLQLVLWPAQLVQDPALCQVSTAALVYAVCVLKSMLSKSLQQPTQATGLVKDEQTHFEWIMDVQLVCLTLANHTCPWLWPPAERSAAVEHYMP